MSSSSSSPDAAVLPLLLPLVSRCTVCTHTLGLAEEFTLRYSSTFTLRQSSKLRAHRAIRNMQPNLLVPAAVTPNVKRFTSEDGTAVYAEAVGSPSNPHVVFLHGFSLSTVVFDCIFYNPRYAEHFYLVRYDMRGHGRSGKPRAAEAYASQRFAQDFAAVAKAYNLKRPVFAGWSLGGTTESYKCVLGARLRF